MRKINRWFLVIALGAALIIVAVLMSSKPTPVQSQSISTSVATLDGRYTYVANFYQHSVSVIDNSTGGLVTTIPVGPGPTSVTLSADGRTVQVICTRGHAGGLIDIATNRIVKTFVIHH